MTHPITPPPELVRQWTTSFDCPEAWGPKDQWIASKAAQWGADQELEACCEWLGAGKRENLGEVLSLRAARRPKPPSLKEQALRILVENGTTLDGRIELEPEDIPIIRQALETLPND
jgi:hypothetical protein